MTMPKNISHTLSVVIPVYGASLNLDPLYARLKAVLEQLSDVTQYEIIFVEDCSKDASWQVIKQLAAKDPCVKGIHFTRNYGQHNALLCGIRAAQYETIVTMDDDLQNPPEEIPTLLNKLAEGYDVVYGSPEKKQHGFFRDCASIITKYVLQGAMGAETAREASAFRAFRTPLRQAFEHYRNPFVSIDVLLTWATNNFSYVIVKHNSRQQGSSGYTLRKLITQAANMMTGFSVVPLQLASIVGFLFSLFGFMILAYVLVRYLINGSQVPGFYFLASIIAIFSGTQLFAIGIIGEYIARMHFSSMGRIAYSVRESTDNYSTNR
jgi:undecaprenyl-phosphate 4-deoxy-4-formamido-L-arabinose transferase